MRDGRGASTGNSLNDEVIDNGFQRLQGREAMVELVSV
jgi:hypothetical protein